MKRLAAILPVLLVTGQCPAAGPDCQRHETHATYRACLERLASQADIDLVRQENVLRSKIGQWDETPDARRNSLQRFDLDAATYRRYRQSRCDYAASRAAGGNGAHDMRLSCRIALDAQRSEMIRDDAASLGARTP